MKKFCLLFILFISLCSCGWNENKIPDGEKLLEEELQNIDWTQVDAYPSVVSCDSMWSEELRKQCFFTYLTMHIQEKLSLDTLSCSGWDIDTLKLKITVHPDSHLDFEPYYEKDTQLANYKEIDSLLKLRLTDFPEIKPAIKRGIPVKTQFVLPVIFKVE